MTVADNNFPSEGKTASQTETEATAKTEAEAARPDSAAARVGRFAIGSLFGVVFIGMCFAMLTAALRGPDTVKVEGAATGKTGLLDPAPTERLKVGDTAPDFVLPQLGGDPVQLSKLHGKTVLVNFWASWCDPCKEEMPAIEQFYEKYKDQNVVVLTVNMQETGDVVKGYFKENNLKMPALLDAEGAVPGGYRATGVPESYFIDKTGKIGAVNIGPMDDKTLDEHLQATWKSGGK